MLHSLLKSQSYAGGVSPSKIYDRFHSLETHLREPLSWENLKAHVLKKHVCNKRKARAQLLYPIDLALCTDINTYFTRHLFLKTISSASLLLSEIPLLAKLLGPE